MSSAYQGEVGRTVIVLVTRSMSRETKSDDSSAFSHDSVIANRSTSLSLIFKVLLFTDLAFRRQKLS